VLEGLWSESLVVIEFPTTEHVANWYASEAYQRILPLRLRHADGWAVLAEGVSFSHVATDVLKPLADAA
jgi:uncharacterized protein (DUF1330 family)